MSNEEYHILGYEIEGDEVVAIVLKVVDGIPRLVTHTDTWNVSLPTQSDTLKESNV